MHVVTNVENIRPAANISNILLYFSVPNLQALISFSYNYAKRYYHPKLKDNKTKSWSY
jgi:hypothetical protein